MILAKDALQVAMGKENVADTVDPADHRLLSFVYADGGNMEAVVAFTIAGTACQPVGMTVSRTESAIG